MFGIAKTKKQIRFKAVETPTAWIVFAVAWKNVGGKIIYSQPKVVKIVQKEGTAIAASSTETTQASAVQDPKTIFLPIFSEIKTEYAAFIKSPYYFSYSPVRSGSITKYGARPPTVKK